MSSAAAQKRRDRAAEEPADETDHRGASSAPAGSPVFTNEAGKISLVYPAGWVPTPDAAQCLKAVAPGPAYAELTLEIPHLQFHIPNLIPINLVQDGYIDSVKKEMPDAVVTLLPDPVIVDAKVKRVKLTGTQNGRPTVNQAALIVHGDAVYVLRAVGEQSQEPACTAALDAAVASIRWTK